MMLPDDYDKLADRADIRSNGGVPPELEPRVAELEAAVQFYRNKAERAEEWLSKISSEIQERVIGKAH
jgi:hypothetical protein